MRLSSAVALVSFAATSLFAGVNASEAEDVKSDVLVLGQENFTATVPAEKLILVEFYAPWCGHCQALAPEYEIAATELKEHNIPVAKVDCTVHTELCQEHGVQGYPTLKIFKEGEATDYQGPRKADGIVSYLKKQSLPALSQLSAETFTTFSTSDKVVVIGVLPKDSEKRAVLEHVANLLRDDYVFGVVEPSEDIQETTGITLFKQFDEGKNVLAGEEFDEDSLVDFIRENGMPIVDEIGPQNYARYMDSGLPLAYLFAGSDEHRDQYRAEIETLAKELKGKMNFVFIDGEKFGAHAENLNLQESWPAFGIQDVHVGTKYPLDQSKELTIEDIRTLADGVLNGTAEPSIKSELVPETNDGPVKVVVATTYKEIVEDQSKDVLIEFYAPWCGHCKALAPIYEQIGELYKGSDIVVAKMDATANDLPLDLPFEVPGFPTIKFRKAGSSEYVDYEGDRSAAAFVEFLNENAVNKFHVDVPEEKPVTADEIEQEHDEMEESHDEQDHEHDEMEQDQSEIEQDHELAEKEQEQEQEQEKEQAEIEHDEL
ncbi:protein disulfide-isomerase precursor [Gryganskiella cystojenkinii]|nr:protein disulfide-isomerase precursor [Gryganskiella cystojenkinii]